MHLGPGIVNDVFQNKYTIDEWCDHCDTKSDQFRRILSLTKALHDNWIEDCIQLHRTVSCVDRPQKQWLAIRGLMISDPSPGSELAINHDTFRNISSVFEKRIDTHLKSPS